MLTKWIRTFSYIEDYFRTLYDVYAGTYIACYPVTYYSLDFDNSICDRTEILSLSYEKDGVGALSGVKWKKIYMLPVYNIETTRFNPTNNERGILYEPSSQIVLPSVYGLIPNPGDVVDLSHGYIAPHPNEFNKKMLYSVTAVNLAHQNEYFQIYQLPLKNAVFDNDLLDRQVSGFYQFYDLEKRILPANNVVHLLKLQNNIAETVKDLNKYFDKQMGFYIQGEF
jgi:hypothetical protein